MDRRFIIILVIVVLGLGGLFFFTQKKDTSPTVVTGSVSNHKKGGNAKNVELKVYGDFECTACKAFYPIEKQVVDKYINDISFVFRHFPIDSIHQNARSAARAAEAAGNQNKFFEMHDMLYENYDLWVRSNEPLTVYEKFAKTLNLNIEKFKTDYASEATNSTINADSKEGSDKGVDGTPTYLINGKKLKGEDISTVEKFSKIIDEAIKTSSTQNR